jgi:copper chaperone
MATGGCSCCAPTTQVATPAGQHSAHPAGTVSAAATYPVEGMSCGHCVGAVAAAVSALPGADEVHIDLVPGGLSRLTVSGPVPANAVRTAIEDAGYRVLIP